MCDLDAISYLLMAAEAAQIAVIALLAAAAILNINIFTFFGATPLMVGSLIAAGVAVASLTAALVIANSCTNAACAGFASNLQYLIGELIAAFSAIAIAIGVCMVPAAVPYVGAIAIAVIIVAVGAQMVAWKAISDAITNLATCFRSASNATAAVTYGADVVAAIIFAALAIIGGISGNRMRKSGGSGPTPD